MCDLKSLRSALAYAQSDQSLCRSHEYSMTVKLMIEHYLEFLSLIKGCTGSYESTLVKLSHCWKSHVMAHIRLLLLLFVSDEVCRQTYMGANCCISPHGLIDHITSIS